MSNIEKILSLEKVGVDYNLVMERFLDNSDVYLKFVKKFSNNKDYNSFLKNIQICDYKKAADEIHNIKGIAGNLGFEKLFNICEKVYSYLNANNYDELYELLEELNKKYRDVIDIINNIWRKD